MSDNPLKLKSILLEDTSTKEKQEFAEMLAKMCADAELFKKGHRCWFFVPTQAEYDIMKKYVDGAPCPKCKKGRVVAEIYKGNLGDCIWMKCYWGEEGCDFKESAYVDESHD